MGAISSLSLQVSRGRALIASGATPSQVLLSLRQWQHSVPRGRKAPGENVLRWNSKLCAAIHETMSLGAPIGELLREIQPMVRREEKLWKRLKGVERQLGFQGAVAIVMPWAVAGLTEGVHANVFTAGALILQLAGLLLFHGFVAQATRTPDKEQFLVFDLLLSAWMRVLAGSSLLKALEASVHGLESVVKPGSRWLKKRRLPAVFMMMWRTWLEGVRDGKRTAIQGTREGLWQNARGFAFPVSEEVTGILEVLLTTGAPAGQVVKDYLEQLDDLRQTEIEEQLGLLPSRLSLVFCLFLAPSVFLLLLGALWPSLSVLQI